MGQCISVRVTPRAKQSKVVGIKDGVLRVRVVAPPVDGKANKELVVLLADYFQIKAREVVIVSGEQSRDKVIEVPESVPTLQKGLF